MSGGGLPNGTNSTSIELARIEADKQLELARIAADKETRLFESQQQFRTHRATRIIVGSVMSLFIIAVSTIIITKPILEVLLGAILAMVLGLGTVTWIAMRISLKYVEKATDRVRDLELKVDSTRTSSSLSRASLATKAEVGADE